MAYPFYTPNQYQQYFPTSYQPMQIPQQQMQQIQPQQTMNQPVNPVPYQSGYIYVSGFEEVNNYPVAPNCTVRFFHKTKPIMYEKSADSSGKPSVTAFDLIKRADPETDDEKKPEYATRSDLGQVVDVMKDYSAILDTLKNDVDAIKGDMYGIAGKKKAARKTEVADDE